MENCAHGFCRIESSFVMGSFAMESFASRTGTFNRGADPNKRKKRKSVESALIMASRKSHLKVVEELVNAGANPNFKTRFIFGKTARHKADSTDVKEFFSQSRSRIRFKEQRQLMMI